MGKQHKKIDIDVPVLAPAPRYPKPELGDRFTFTPEAFVGETRTEVPGRMAMPRKVTGWVSYINEKHRYFKVDYEVNGYHLSESFKF